MTPLSSSIHLNCMMKTEYLNNLIEQWTALGASFGSRPWLGMIDIERLLLDTARHSPFQSRLFIMAATWLHAYGDLVAKHRLKRLICEELEDEHRPTIGLLLDIAQQGTHPLEFQSIIRHLEPNDCPHPLYNISRKNDRLALRAEKRASRISKRWGLWCEPFDLKHDALRPASWMIRSHPELRTRADFRGDLRASILAALRCDPGAGHSELRLARLAGGSRAQVRNALNNLQMTNRVRCEPAAGANRIEISLPEREYELIGQCAARIH